ncbi:MAG: hypothetical protein HRT45_09395 [Bdellovibrionales bacterium]|nr:hypothetical protein [Bdellovibrionales bacterium]
MLSKSVLNLIVASIAVCIFSHSALATGNSAGGFSSCRQEVFDLKAFEQELSQKFALYEAELRNNEFLNSDLGEQYIGFVRQSVQEQSEGLFYFVRWAFDPALWQDHISNADDRKANAASILAALETTLTYEQQMIDYFKNLYPLDLNVTYSSIVRRVLMRRELMPEEVLLALSNHEGIVGGLSRANLQ